MALVTHQMQGSYVTSPSRSCLSIGAPLVRGPKAKAVRISAFKGSAQNDESGGRASGSKSDKNSVELCYVQKGSEETLTESPKMQDVPLSYASEADETIAGSVAIQKLFKNWLMLLRTQPPNQVVDESLEGPELGKISVMQNGAQKKERGEILKAVWCYFGGLDATVKIPLLIFIPWYLAVNVVYGAAVSKELIPLWVLGPLIVALYIKMFRGLCALYVLSFKQTVKVLRNLPAYYAVAYSYIARGKLKEDMHAYLWQPVVDIKNLDYKELSKRRMKDVEVWAVERYLDFVESIWPSYCRTIRFLKRANFI